MPDAEKQPVEAAAAPAAAVHAAPRSVEFVPLRREIPLWQSIAYGVLCIGVCFGLWWVLTEGDVGEERIVTPVVLPSPAETFDKFPSLWFDAALTRNTFWSLRRVVLGFGLAALVGVPLGVLCGCFRQLGALLAPLTIMGRNAPIAAVIPLTFAVFGADELQKVMFIFIACVAFIVIDTANAIAEVSERYVDSAYTLGANRRQIIMKVLVPLAMPGVFNSMRLLFGLAFGYIMLAEVVQEADRGGLGSIIISAQHRRNNEFILLVLMIIPLVALAVDRILYWIQRQLFPYCYGGSGFLHRLLVQGLRSMEDVLACFRKPAAPPVGHVAQTKT